MHTQQSIFLPVISHFVFVTSSAWEMAVEFENFQLPKRTKCTEKKLIDQILLRNQNDHACIVNGRTKLSEWNVVFIEGMFCILLLWRSWIPCPLYRVCKSLHKYCHPSYKNPYGFKKAVNYKIKLNSQFITTT